MLPDGLGFQAQGGPAGGTVAAEGGGPADTRLQGPSGLLGNYWNVIPLYVSEYAKLWGTNPVPLAVNDPKSLRQLPCFIWNFPES